MTTVHSIAKRAASLTNLDEYTVMMDLTACTFGGCNLDLEALNKADDFNFLHDIVGINRHLDHNTYRLRDCFWPRFAKP